MSSASKPGSPKSKTSRTKTSRSDTSGPKSPRAKVQDYRDRLRAQGLRPIQIWVPDVRAPSFRAEAHRQSAAVAASAHAREDQAFIDAVSVDE